MSDKNSPGRPSAWDKRLSKTEKNTYWCPPEVYPLLKQNKTKEMLSAMVLDPNIRDKAWELGQ